MGIGRIIGNEGDKTYPEIDFEVPRTAEFSIADLESNGHFVVFMELFVEAFSGMGAHLDIMRQSDVEKIR